MKIKILIGLLAVTMLWAFCGMALAAEVVQGACVSYDEKAKTMVLQNERDKKEVNFDLSQAKVGARPEKGNLIRVAFRPEGGKNMALKVMNVTKQDLRKK